MIRPRRGPPSVVGMRRIGLLILWIFGLYLIVRAIAEPFVIDMSDPATYRQDWGLMARGLRAGLTR
jgi:hypothetical protein